MKTIPTSNNRAEHKNAHNLNNEATTADITTSIPAITYPMHNWTPPPNYPPSIVTRHHQHNYIKITNQTATSPKQTPHTKIQIPAAITLATIVYSNKAEKNEEKEMHVQNRKDVTTHTVERALDNDTNTHNVHNRSKNRQRSTAPCNMEIKGPATKSLPKKIPSRPNITERVENGSNTEATNTLTSKTPTQKPNNQYDTMSKDESEKRRR